MKITDSLEKLSLPENAPVVLTLGCFDGFHVGHRQIIRRLKLAADSLGAMCGLLTFDPHPAQALQGITGPFLIDTRREKEELLEMLPLDFAVFFNFSPDFAAIPAEKFIQNLAARLSLRKMVVGPDTRFGHRGGGTVALLEAEGEKLGFEVEVVEKVEADGEPVSSTRIRELVAEGGVEKAAEFLGRPFRVSGEVVAGDGRSRSNGFPPTVNLDVEAGKLLPRDGVYAVRVLIGDAEHGGVANVGTRPTVGGKKRIVEAHIFGFSGGLYGARVCIDFERFIREEKRFAGLDELKSQIQKDIEVAEKMYNV